MKPFRIGIAPAADHCITHLPPALKSRVKKALDHLRSNPTAGKPLQDNLEGFFSYRIGRWRLIYNIHRPEYLLRVFLLGPRHTVYQDIAALLATQ